MLQIVNPARRFLVAAMVALGLSTATFSVTSVLAPQQADAGILKKAKKGTKLIGKGAGWVEKKLASKGKVGKVVSKGFGGIRKGANKASKGVGKVQKGASKAFKKVCKGPCQTVAKGVKKVSKGLKHVKREAERKCSQFGRDSKICKIAMDAAEFASPI